VSADSRYWHTGTAGARTSGRLFYWGLSASRARSSALAPFRASVPLLSSPLEPAGDLLGLLKIFIGRAPEQHPAGHAPDRDGDVELACNAQQIVSHPPLGDVRAQADAGGLGGQGAAIGLAGQQICDPWPWRMITTNCFPVLLARAHPERKFSGDGSRHPV
jgi:hypothetical protein